MVGPLMLKRNSICIFSKLSKINLRKPQQQSSSLRFTKVDRMWYGTYKGNGTVLTVVNKIFKKGQLNLNF
jgi:hypothetical protein